jgi:hypothetical protein
MPAFTLYGSRGSTNTDRVRLTLAEGGFTDYELVLLNLQKGEQKVGDPFFFGKTMRLLLRTQIVYGIKPQNFFSLIKYLFPYLQRSILVGANAVASSPKNTRNVTRVVKYP